MENLYTPNCIRTFTGKYVNVFEPTLDMFCIEDIAHALSHQCRFGGHLPQYYSVAEHSIMCSRLSQYPLEALMHDAAEAYIIDLPSPIKNKLENYKEIEDNIMKVLSYKFKFIYPLPDNVKLIDKMMLENEWYNLMLQKKEAYTLVNFECLNPKAAKQIFLETYEKLQY